VSASLALYDEFLLASAWACDQRVRRLPRLSGGRSAEPAALRRRVVARKNPEVLAEFNVRYVLSAMHWRHADSCRS